MSEPAPLVLTILAVTLAGPVPTLLARASWPARAPRAAVALWQAVALAAVLATLGAGVSAGLLVVTAAQPGPVVIVLHGVAMLVTVVVTVRLVWSGHTLGVGLRARRRRHREAVDLLGGADPRAPGAAVVDLGAPVAYCLPGLRSRLVVSRAVLDTLAADEVRAVLEHERAHLRARHDLVVEGFGALHQAFPRVVRSRSTLDATSGLVEMLADDAARSRTGSLPLARALVTLASAPVPAASLGSGAVAVEARVRRLAADPTRGRAVAALAYAGAAAVLVVPTVTVVLPWLLRLLDAAGA